MHKAAAIRLTTKHERDGDEQHRNQASVITANLRRNLNLFIQRPWKAKNRKMHTIQDGFRATSLGFLTHEMFSSNAATIRPERYGKKWNTFKNVAVSLIINSNEFHFNFFYTLFAALLLSMVDVLFLFFEENNPRIMFYMPRSDDSFIIFLCLQVGLTQLWVIKCQFACNFFFSRISRLLRKLYETREKRHDRSEIKANIKCVCLTVWAWGAVKGAPNCTWRAFHVFLPVIFHCYFFFLWCSTWLQNLVHAHTQTAAASTLSACLYFRFSV